jgi:hypothetical protein
MVEREDQRRSPAGTPEEAYQRALHAELDRRVAELGATSDQAFGRIGPGDGIVVALLFVVLPALVIWVAR